MVIVAVAVRFAASVAVTVTLLVPAVVGVPEIAPVDELMLTPAGRPVADHVTVPLAPEAVNDTLTGEPTFTATAELDGVIVNDTGDTVMVTVAVAVLPAASFAVTVTLDVPTAVGVPEIAPVDELMLTPAGRPVADHVTVPLAPEAVNVTVVIAEPTFTDTVELDALIVNGGTGPSFDVTLTLIVAVAVLSPESLAVTVTL